MLGSDDPAVDAEVIALLAELLEKRGARELRLRLSSLGTADTRREYSEELKTFLRVACGRARAGRAGADRREPAARVRLG